MIASDPRRRDPAHKDKSTHKEGITSLNSSMTFSAPSSEGCRCTAISGEGMFTRIALEIQLSVRQQPKQGPGASPTPTRRFQLLLHLHHILRHLHTRASLRVQTQLLHRPLRGLPHQDQDLNPQCRVLRQPEVSLGGKESSIQAQCRDADRSLAHHLSLKELLGFKKRKKKVVRVRISLKSRPQTVILHWPGQSSEHDVLPPHKLIPRESRRLPKGSDLHEMMMYNL